jgi:hypothetical protein
MYEQTLSVPGHDVGSIWNDDYWRSIAAEGKRLISRRAERAHTLGLASNSDSVIEKAAPWGAQRGFFVSIILADPPVTSIALPARVRKSWELPVDAISDIDDLVWHFARNLPVDRRDEFHLAALSALSQLSHVGPGSVHRTLTRLVRGYFIPVPTVAIGAEVRIGSRCPRQRRPSKLVNAAPVA